MEVYSINEARNALKTGIDDLTVDFKTGYVPTEKEWESFLKIISESSKLKMLTLKNSHCSADACALVGRLFTNSSLMKVQLIGCSVDDAGVKRLKQDMNKEGSSVKEIVIHNSF